MKSTDSVRRALWRQINATDFIQVDDIPPAPPWIERKFTVGRWGEWNFNPFFIPGLSSLIAGVIIIPPAVILGSGVGGVFLIILAILAAVAWPAYTFVSMKRNTHTYVSTNKNGTRYIAEVTVVGRNSDSYRARVIAEDSPVRISL